MQVLDLGDQLLDLRLQQRNLAHPPPARRPFSASNSAMRLSGVMLPGYTRSASPPEQSRTPFDPAPPLWRQTFRRTTLVAQD